MTDLLSIPAGLVRGLLSAPGAIAGLLGAQPAPSGAPGSGDADAALAPPYHPVRSAILGTLLPTLEARLEQNEAQRYAAARSQAIYRSLPTPELRAAYSMDPEGVTQAWERSLVARNLGPGQTAAYGDADGARSTSANTSDDGDNEGADAGAALSAPAAPSSGRGAAVSPSAYSGSPRQAALPPTLAAVHADTADILGPPAADHLLLQSGGDPSRYLALRTQAAWRRAALDPSARPYLSPLQQRNRQLGALIDAYQGLQA